MAWVGAIWPGDDGRRVTSRLKAAAIMSAAMVILATVANIVFVSPAEAIPVFARQTGQPCGTCHTDFPGLTPFGRQFKLNGYTAGGGAYRSQLFPRDPVETQKPWAPPVAIFGVLGFTHTEAPQPNPAPYKPNDNVVAGPISFFTGGAITDHIGAFAQMTYSPTPPGGLGPFDHNWSWDNVDIRYANRTVIGDVPVVFGLTANNNPTVQDVWNTVPAWVFPYMTSVTGSPDAPPNPFGRAGPPAPLIDGALAQRVASAGGYVYVDGKLYLEASAYGSLNFKTQNNLGVNPFGGPGLIDGAAPYVRAAYEQNWRDHSFQIGAFGMFASIRPWIGPTDGTGSLDTLPFTDKYTDIGIDTQYQYRGSNYWLTLRGSYIHEIQRLDASFAAFNTNQSNTLNNLRAQASLAYGGDNRIVLTGQYFKTWGSPDPTLYPAGAGVPDDLNPNFSPNTSGWTAEIAYIPFMESRAPIWPWLNARIGLQYTYYNEFSGDRIHAHDNNTLFAYIWFAM